MAPSPWALARAAAAALLCALCASGSCTVHVSSDDGCDDPDLDLDDPGKGVDHGCDASLEPPPVLVEWIAVAAGGEIERGVAWIDAR